MSRASDPRIGKITALKDKLDELERQLKRFTALGEELPPDTESPTRTEGLLPAEETMSPVIPDPRETPFAGVARGGVLNLAGAFVSAVVTLAVILVVARGLSRVDAGVVFGATSLLVLVATAARLGTDVTIVHVLASARAVERPEDVRPYLRAALVPVTVVGALAGAAVAVAGVHVLDLVTRGAEVAHGGALIVLVGAAVPVAAAYEVVTAATRGLGRMRPTIVIERLVRPTLQLVLVVVAIIAGGGAFAVVCAWIAPYGVAAVAATGALVRLLPETTAARSSAATIDFAAFWRFTLPRALAGTIQVALQRMDILLVGALRGAAAAAVYTAATRFFVVGQLGNQAIWYAVQPRLAMLVASRDLDAARRLYRVSTAWVIAVTWPLALAVLVAAPLILNAFGRGYDSGKSTMVLMSIALLFSSACGLVDIVLITVGRTSWNLWDTALAFVVNIAIDAGVDSANRHRRRRDRVGCGDLRAERARAGSGRSRVWLPPVQSRRGARRARCRGLLRRDPGCCVVGVRAARIGSRCSAVSGHGGLRGPALADAGGASPRSPRDGARRAASSGAREVLGAFGEPRERARHGPAQEALANAGPMSYTRGRRRTLSAWRARVA